MNIIVQKLIQVIREVTVVRILRNLLKIYFLF